MTRAWLRAQGLWRSRVAVIALVAIALAVRLVGITSGLPFAYNPDEELHFVPPAAAAADGRLDPGYFENPSGLTYLLALVLRVRYVGRDVTDVLASDPGSVYLVGRIVVALLGTLLVLLVHLAGRRFFGQAAGLGAGALMAVGFLPIHYSRQALNDVPTMLPVAVALVACLLAYEHGRWRDVLLAGVAVGVAAATKYTAGPVSLVVALAVLCRVLERRERPVRACVLLGGAGLLCVGTFLLLNPYLVLHFSLARSQLNGQSAQAASGKLGQVGSAWSTYPETLLWGLGALPVAMALVGLVLALRGDRAPRVRALLLAVFPLVLVAYLSTQDRFFARWLLPAYPALAILAGHGMARVAGLVRRHAGPRLRVVAPGVVVAVVLAQPVLDLAHHATVVSRDDTRTQALAWIRSNIPAGSRVVVEPSFPANYLEGVDVVTYPIARPYQTYELGLEPGLVDVYRNSGYCWVVVTSFQRDRGLAADLAGARAYYARLDREAAAHNEFSPYHPGARAPDFSFDRTFNWHSRAYDRPGPLLDVVRLRDCVAKS